MSKLSMTGVGIIVFALSQLFAWKGVPVAEGDLEHLVEIATEFIGALMTIWGQIRRPEVSMGVFKK